MKYLGTYDTHLKVRPFGLLLRADSCASLECMPETEARLYRLGSPLASIAGIAQATLERNDLDDDVVMRLRAIRDLALDALAKAERGDPEPPARTQA